MQVEYPSNLDLTPIQAPRLDLLAELYIIYYVSNF